MSAAPRFLMAARPCIMPALRPRAEGRHVETGMAPRPAPAQRAQQSLTLRTHQCLPDGVLREYKHNPALCQVQPSERRCERIRAPDAAIIRELSAVDQDRRRDGRCEDGLRLGVMSVLALAAPSRRALRTAPLGTAGTAQRCDAAWCGMARFPRRP